LDTIVRLEEARMRIWEMKDRFYRKSREADQAYQQAFAGYGLPFETLDSPESVARIKGSAIRKWLGPALDYWGILLGNADRGRLLQVAQQVDEDGWRRRYREALRRRDRRALAELARHPQAQAQLPATLGTLSQALLEEGDRDGALAVLRPALVRS